jgi:hypothetical protein
MTPEEPDQRYLEIAISERVFSRLKTQMLVVYIVSFVLAAAVAWSLTWQYRTLSDLASPESPSTSFSSRRARRATVSTSRR